MFGRIIVGGGKEVWGVEQSLPLQGRFFIRFNGGRYEFNHVATNAWTLRRMAYRAGRLIVDPTYREKTFHSQRALQLELERLLEKEVK